jgi:hypothetical protein
MHADEGEPVKCLQLHRPARRSSLLKTHQNSIGRWTYVPRAGPISTETQRPSRCLYHAAWPASQPYRLGQSAAAEPFHAALSTSLSPNALSIEDIRPWSDTPLQRGNASCRLLTTLAHSNRRNCVRALAIRLLIVPSLHPQTRPASAYERPRFTTSISASRW